MNETATTPGWVILGAQRPDGVMILASKELNSAELSHEMECDEPLWTYLGHRHERRIIKLTTDMRTYVMVKAETYDEALRRLFMFWTPEPDEQRALDGPQKAIEAERMTA